MKHVRKVEPIGSRFGALVVVGDPVSVGGRLRFPCRCDCGVVLDAFGAELRNGQTKFCRECLRRARSARTSALNANGTAYRKTAHEHTWRGGVSPTYSSWRAARARCEYLGTAGYHHYGGRGIAVCERWHTFANFLADMGERPIGTTLDRIDNTKGYEPGNCRWATPAEQRRNSSRTILNADSVNEIRGRHEYGENNVSIARRFGVSSEAIWSVVNRRSWKDIP